ncbi:Aklavinone 12-hydroxylase RdmE [Mycobacterium attenuatum]|uniref:Aklavinone 12-hydroxylase RdmE n=1 Tax=Mycobacterium attenuatum TaxID=2341086 RepID=A0A498Q677_9MYCO|nr:Aklavinone 12-hydroxylase RdmE [Mycobacterium attenuatum]
MSDTHVPVLIVGAGVGGLAASALLAQHGIRSLLVDKRHETFTYPKARNLSFRSLEILRGLGVGDQTRAVAEHVSTMLAKPTLNSAEERPAIDMDAIFAGLDTLSPEPVAQYCPQSKSEPILLGAARARGSEVRYGTELVSFDMDEAGVTARIADRTSGERQTVRADYLIAADGVHSPVRTALSVTTSGYGALPSYVVFIYFRASWRHVVSHLSDGDAVQVTNPEAPGIFLTVADDLGMFITTYFPAKDDTVQRFTPQRCRNLLAAAIGERLDVQIIEVASWQLTNRWPTNSAVVVHFWSVIRRTRCRRSRPGEPTSQSRAHTTWPGSWLPSCREPPVRGCWPPITPSVTRSADSRRASPSPARPSPCSSWTPTDPGCPPAKSARCSSC